VGQLKKNILSAANAVSKRFDMRFYLNKIDVGCI
jgi:hypothetical protein